MRNTHFHASALLWFVYLIMFGTLLYLGQWQARKVGPKTEMLAQIELGMAADPTELLPHLDDPQAIEYQRVYFTGILMDVEAIHVFGTNLAGAPGFYIYVPVQRLVGDPVIVNFGWVPYDHTGPVYLPKGEPVQISGIMRASGRSGSFTPANEPDNNIWFNADVYAMAAHFGLDEFERYRIFYDGDHVSEDNQLPVPLGGQTIVNIPNNHLSYAFTWYGLALSLTGVFVFYGFSSQSKGLK